MEILSDNWNTTLLKMKRYGDSQLVRETSNIQIVSIVIQSSSHFEKVEKVMVLNRCIRPSLDLFIPLIS
jgi:hypothetical protein